MERDVSCPGAMYKKKHAHTEHTVAFEWEIAGEKFYLAGGKIGETWGKIGFSRGKIRFTLRRACGKTSTAEGKKSDRGVLL